jgi:hypothetical protein
MQDKNFNAYSIADAHLVSLAKIIFQNLYLGKYCKRAKHCVNFCSKFWVSFRKYRLQRRSYTFDENKLKIIKSCSNL